ncbi:MULTISPECIES: hypothetical protein [Streptomyces]|uniref:Uncharacterized protein n=1 Tax=Streptomyces reniochalinae TaxID=2250578 RepID=A0A367EC22_9ACTN|nr:MULTISPECIES: hypothetical protein [Streptomyces]RCG14887.1 hypothetical protein DQ392_27830 [Streptomyces reniochalinae]
MPTISSPAPALPFAARLFEGPVAPTTPEATGSAYSTAVQVTMAPDGAPLVQAHPGASVQKTAVTVSGRPGDDPEPMITNWW